MKAGRELDALVAEKVMGWDGCHSIHYCEDTWYNYCKNPGCYATGADEDEMIGSWDGGEPPIPGCKGYPPYSTSIAEAWLVVEKFDTWEVHRWYDPKYKRYDGDFYVSCYLTKHDPEMFGEATADTAPLAICRAALKAAESVVK